jgi:hypothetical protein
MELLLLMTRQFQNDALVKLLRRRVQRYQWVRRADIWFMRARRNPQLVDETMQELLDREVTRSRSVMARRICGAVMPDS